MNEQKLGFLLNVITTLMASLPGENNEFVLHLIINGIPFTTASNLDADEAKEALRVALNLLEVEQKGIAITFSNN